MEITFSLSSLTLTLLLLKIVSSATISNFTTDQNALLAFKTSLTSDSLLTKNWSTNTPTCSWVGVSCGFKHRRVTALNVSGYQLVGTISPHLGNLTFLRSLDISYNNFTGVIPSELFKLRRLEEMNMGFNNLTGEIPPWFGGLPQLQYIYLGNNSFSGSIPSALSNMSSLIEIDMRYNLLSGTLSDDICSNTPNLRSMYLTGNQFSGEIPANIYKCRGMEDLHLGGNLFNGSIPSEIGSLSMLQLLALWSNQFTGRIPSSIFNMSSLRSLDLSDNHLSGSIPSGIPYDILEIYEIFLYQNQLTGSIPKQFGNLTSLTTLDVASNLLTGELPEELGNLAYLEIFGAPYNNLTGSIPSSIFNISTLLILGLQQNLLSGPLPSITGLSLYSLQELYLHYNRFTGEIPTSITNISQLTILELNRNSLTGPIPNFGNLRNLTALRLWENNLTAADSPTQEWGFISSLTNCRYLETLEITDNPLNGIIPASIGNFSSSLYRIWASYGNINGGIPAEIGNLIGLQSIRLTGNRLTGFIPTEIKKLNNIQEIFLGDNRLQGYIPNELCQLRNLGTLNLSYNTFTGPIHECFGELSSLREVSLGSNRLNSTIPSKFWDLTGLLILDLSSNNLSGQVSPRIGSWEVNQLDLSFNQFSGNIPRSIGDCLSMESLWLSNNEFRGSIPDTLGNVKGLTTLDLSHNELSGEIPDTLEDLRVLENFDVSYNRLEGDIPDGISNSTAQSFVHNSGLCGAPRFQVPRCRHGRSRSKTIALIFLKYVLPVAAAIMVVVVVLMFIRRRKRAAKPLPVSDISLEKIARISYVELVRGTSAFSEMNLLGRGSYGSVYKATLSDGLNIAVKVFNLELEGATKSFDTESGILSSIRHRNLLSVISCCTNADFRALILEYMPNGSLEKWLHSDSYALDLVQRLNIATDVALALEYLHHDHTFPVVHCDIKPSNVLLDKDMTAHVADFGISKLFDEGEVMTHTTTLATVGYAAPEYGSEGKVSTKGDVYSYGILLLEMFTRKKPTDDMFSGEMSLKEWVEGALQENAGSEIVAPGLLSSEDQHISAKEECVSSVFDMAMKCLAFSPDERIDMIQVVAALRKIKIKVTAAIEVNNRTRRR
ncbi:hypothetical protein ACS0TY_028251 [Phlomoides rotata]